ncbi:MAG: SGNH/GDSL hydrolase family protein [Candidatus Solibacter sp.]
MRLSFALALLALPAMGQKAEVNWIQPNDSSLEIDGLPWFGENGGQWIRLPVRLQNTLPKSVWSLGNSPSGGRIRFRTDSNLIAIRLEYPSGPDMANMHAFGQTGVDLYLDGIYRGTAVAKKDSKPGEPVEQIYVDLKGQPRVEREAAIYLSLYKPVKVLAVGLDADARIRKAQPFAVSKPVVYYGTSITQGGCASRPGMSYQAILGRMLHLDFVNLGFSGSGKGEPEVARMVAEIDASAFVFDFAQNNLTAASLREVYEPFLNTVREKHPRTPIVVITPIANSREALSADGEVQGMRALIRNVAGKHIAAGDEHLQVVEGTDLLGPERADGLVDGTHPNDLGFQWMAEGLAPRLRSVLNLRQ